MKVERRMIHFDVSGVKTVTHRDVTWEEVRQRRDSALKDSDWRAGKDVVMSTAWRDYRQSLRDLGGFDSANDAADNWPVMPDA